MEKGAGREAMSELRAPDFISHRGDEMTGVPARV